MKRYVIGWTECVYCEAEIDAKDADEAIETARVAYMANKDIATSKDRPYAECFEVIEEEEI